MNLDNPYGELGLAPGSSDAEVKAAWRRLSAHWHPDRNDSPHALRKIQRINRALEEIRRSRNEAGTGAQKDVPQPTVDHNLTITLEEAVSGCTRELQGELVEDCADCEGSGLEAAATECGECAGSGHARSPAWFAWMALKAECGACQGQGVTRHRCAACDGSGKAPARSYRCSVQLPPRTRAGTRIEVSTRVQGQPRKPKLALRVRVHVELQPHEFFALEADGTVKCELPVDGFAWTANRWIEVPTPRGLQQMRLRRDYLTYRIKGEGLAPEHSETPADCIVTIVPLFPQEFDSEQEAAIDRLIASNSGSTATAAGDRFATWNRTLAGWQDRMAARA